MKKISFILVAALMMCGASAKAQSVNDEKAFSTIGLSYSPSVDSDNIGYTSALTAEWSRITAGSDGKTMRLQYGAALQYALRKYSKDDGNTTYLTAKIPVNAVYAFNIPDADVMVLPYAGLNVQGHLLAVENYTVTYSDGTVETRKRDYFDQGDDSYGRFGLGCQFGVKAICGKHLVGVGYESPLTEMYGENNFKMRHVSFSFGFVF